MAGFFHRGRLAGISQTLKIALRAAARFCKTLRILEDILISKKTGEESDHDGRIPLRFSMRFFFFMFLYFVSGFCFVQERDILFSDQ